MQQLHIIELGSRFDLDSQDYNDLCLDFSDCIYCTKYAQSKVMIVLWNYTSSTGFKSFLLELYILKDEKVIHLCDSESEKNKYSETLKSLYSDIETTIYRDKTEDDVLDFLNDLMKGGTDNGR